MTEELPRITLEDIAERSGVSISTVSRVVSASRSVGRDSAIRVKKAMEELGFEPKKRVRAQAKPVTIALIMPDTLNPALTAIEIGAQAEAVRLGIGLLILRISDNPDVQRPSLNLLSHLPIDAVIFLSRQIEPEDIRKRCRRREMPIVVLERVVDSAHVHCIDTDRENGMYQAAKYLISLGHRHIAYIASQFGEFSEIPFRGARRAFTEAGLTLAPDFLRWCAPTIEGGFQAASTLLRLPSGNHPTAVLIFSDLLAIGVMRAIQTFGFSIPGDISVVGFDNNCFSPYTNPPLTTVAHPQAQIGQLAVQTLYDSLNGYNVKQGGLTLLECPLIVRESTGPCPHM